MEHRTIRGILKTSNEKMTESLKLAQMSPFGNSPGASFAPCKAMATDPLLSRPFTSPTALVPRSLSHPFDFAPAQPNNRYEMNIYEEIVKLQREGRSGAVATIVNSRGSIPSFQSAKMLVRDDGSIAGTIGGGCVEAEVWQAAREVIAQEKPRTLTFDLNQDPKYDTGLVCGGTLEIFIEPVLPAPLLYIFGAGHVAAGALQGRP